MAAPLTTKYWPGLAQLRVAVPARDRLLKESHIVLEQTRALDRSRFWQTRSGQTNPGRNERSGTTIDDDVLAFLCHQVRGAEQLLAQRFQPVPFRQRIGLADFLQRTLLAARVIGRGGSLPESIMARMAFTVSITLSRKTCVIATSRLRRDP